MNAEQKTKAGEEWTLAQKQAIFAHFRHENYLASMRLEGLPVDQFISGTNLVAAIAKNERATKPQSKPAPAVLRALGRRAAKKVLLAKLLWMHQI